jgi:hypothetical protein
LQPPNKVLRASFELLNFYQIAVGAVGTILSKVSTTRSTLPTTTTATGCKDIVQRISSGWGKRRQDSDRMAARAATRAATRTPITSIPAGTAGTVFKSGRPPGSTQAAISAVTSCASSTTIAAPSAMDLVLFNYWCGPNEVCD